MDGAAAAWVDNSPGRGRKGLDWREVWRYRELVTFLALRDVKVRYKQAAFGMLWAVVRPLAAMAVFTVVFGRLVHAPSDGVPYVLFAFTGVIVWTLFADGLDAATTSLVANAALITKVYFPRVAVPLASVLPRTPGLRSLLGVAGRAARRGPPPARTAVLLLPVVVLWCVVLAFGIGLIFATVNVRYRDAHHALGLLGQVWLFARPGGHPQPRAAGLALGLRPQSHGGPARSAPLGPARDAAAQPVRPGASLSTGLLAVWRDCAPLRETSAVWPT